jgi:hypothetical protein
MHEREGRTVTDTVRTLLQQDDENELYRILTKDQGYIIRCVGDVLMNDDPAFLDLPAQWQIGWMWILEGFEAPEDKWRLLSDEDRDAVWAKAATDGRYLPDELEQVYQEIISERSS